MGLYDRDYARGNSYAYESASRSDSQIISFVKETYKLFAASMMAGAVGAYVGVPMAGAVAAWFIPLFIVEIGLLIGLHFVKHKPGINLDKGEVPGSSPGRPTIFREFALKKLTHVLQYASQVF